MGLFTQYVDEKPAITAKLGTTIRIPLTRDFPREGFTIQIHGKVTTRTSAPLGAGLLNIAKRVRLVVNDGATTRTVVDADGLSIMQRHIHYNQYLDRDTLAAYSQSLASSGNGSNPGKGAFRVTYPHFFAPGSLGSPTRDMFLQNFPRYNNDPYLEIQLASATEIDPSIVIVSDDDAVAANTVEIIVTEFKRVVTLTNWNFVNVAFETFQKDYPVDAPNQRYQVPIPGYHFGIGIRAYTNFAAGIFGDISRDAGLIKIQSLGQVERSISYLGLKHVNDMSDDPDFVGDSFAGTSALNLVDLGDNIIGSEDIARSSAWFDYLTDQTGSDVSNLDTLFNTNAFVNLGATPEIIWDIAGSATTSVIYMHDRCFGDITGALALLKLQQTKASSAKK